LGFIPWISLRISGRTIRSAGTDILCGIIDTGILTIAASFGFRQVGVMEEVGRKFGRL